MGQKLALKTKPDTFFQVVYEISLKLEVDFFAFYACVGLISTILVFLYAFFGFSYLTRYCTRSVSELYSTFVMVCFAFYAYKSTVHSRSTVEGSGNATVLFY